MFFQWSHHVTSHDNMPKVNFELSMVVSQPEVVSMICSAHQCKQDTMRKKILGDIINKFVVSGFFIASQVEQQVIINTTTAVMKHIDGLNPKAVISSQTVNERLCRAMNMILFSNFCNISDLEHGGSSQTMKVLRPTSQICSCMIYYYHVVRKLSFAFGTLDATLSRDILKFEDEMFWEATRKRSANSWCLDNHGDISAVYQSKDILQSVLEYLAAELLSGTNGGLERLFLAVIEHRNRLCSDVLMLTHAHTKSSFKISFKSYLKFFSPKQKKAAIVATLGTFYKSIDSVPRNPSNSECCYTQRYRILCVMTGKCMISTAMKELTDKLALGRDCEFVEKKFFVLAPFVLNQIVSEHEEVGGSVGDFLHMITIKVMEIIFQIVVV